MHKVAIIGHFGFGCELLNGQTVKAKNVADQLEQIYGHDGVIRYDTHGLAKLFFKLPYVLFSALKNSKNIIILPAQNGLKIIVPMLLLLNRFFKRSIHYCVVGGWLPEFVKQKKGLKKKLSLLQGIYVETVEMKRALDAQGIENVSVMPNFKKIRILKGAELVFNDEKPYKLCTFSRVMKEKGIEDAVDAVKRLNAECKATEYELDIYGQIDCNQVEWFKKLSASFPTFVRYLGEIPYDQSVCVLKNYHALLFPTYYEGEGFAGTIIDAMAAGIPTIASDWKYNKELINEKNGLLFETRNVDDLMDKIKIVGQIDKKNIAKEAEKYSPEVAIRIIENNLE